jgi:hypothetical protein
MECLYPHPLHQRLHEGQPVSLGHQKALQHARAGEVKFQMQPIETVYDRKVGRRHRLDAATTDPQKLRLLADRQDGARGRSSPCAQQSRLAERTF